MSHGDQVRADIIEKSIGIFSSKGLEFTTLNEIAKSSDITKSNILYHFKNKENLFVETFRAILIKNKNLFFNEDFKLFEGRAQLKGFIHAHTLWSIHNPKEVQFFLHAMSMGHYFHQISSIVRNVYAGINTQVERMVKSYFSDKKLDSRQLNYTKRRVIEKIFGTYHLLSFDSEYDNDLKKVEEDIIVFLDSLLVE
jgi:AcrR family transcriptional regulator